MTKEEIIEMADQVGYIDLPLITRSMELKELRAFAKLIAEKEREACAKLCDDRVTAYQYSTDPWAQEHIDEAKHLAKTIRTRGQE
jgi:hypothetical protein